VTTRAHFPQPAPIEAYGNGGFRFAGMSHKGSILCLPSGIWAWPVARLADIEPEILAGEIAASEQVSLLLLGTGASLAPAPRALREALDVRGLAVDPMDTGAAARTYNILLAEGRRVAAALIAVD
jgi:uncharacterized protein